MKVLEHIDSFSPGFAFANWRELLGQRVSRLMEEQFESLRAEFGALSSPRSWLCSVGWMRAR
jgi:hypothetical protein